MTDRFKGVVVTFDRDIRSDDAEAIIHAIEMIKNVADVQPSVWDSTDLMNRMRIRREIEAKLWKVLREATDG